MAVLEGRRPQSDHSSLFLRCHRFKEGATPINEKAGCNDAGDNFVGIEGKFALSTLNINPNIEYVSNYDDGTAGSVNIDMTVDVAKYQRLTPFLGGGLGQSVQIGCIVYLEMLRCRQRFATQQRIGRSRFHILLDRILCIARVV